MGMFRDFAKAFKEGMNDSQSKVTTKQSVAPAVNPLNYARMWNIKEPTRAIILDGERSMTLYVYDPRPFANVAVGQRLELETVRGDVGMTSQFTGETWHTKKENDVAIAYNGIIVGISRLDSKVIKEAAKKGYSVFVAARCDGYLQDFDNMKEINLYVPYDMDVNTPIERDKARQLGARGIIDIKRITLIEESHYQELATRNYWEFPHAKMELVHIEGKPKAKPSLGIYSEDGKLFMTVGNRRKLYAELLDLNEQYNEFYFFAYRKDSYDGRAYYDVDLLYW